MSETQPKCLQEQYAPHNACFGCGPANEKGLRIRSFAEGDKLDVIPLDSPLATAIQPFGISRSSDFKHTARRLYERISRSRSVFEAAGFHWRLAESPGRDGDALTTAP